MLNGDGVSVGDDERVSGGVGDGGAARGVSHAAVAHLPGAKLMNTIWSPFHRRGGRHVLGEKVLRAPRPPRTMLMGIFFGRCFSRD